MAKLDSTIIYGDLNVSGSISGNGVIPASKNMGINTDIDMSSAGIFYKTLTENTDFTFSNLIQGKQIKVIIDGPYSISFPPSVIIRETGNYYPDRINVYYFTCIDDSVPLFSSYTTKGESDNFDRTPAEITSTSFSDIRTSSPWDNLTLSKSDAIKPGDFMIIVLSCREAFDANGYNVNTPPGWTLLMDILPQSDTWHNHGKIFYKFADGTEPSVLTLTGFENPDSSRYDSFNPAAIWLGIKNVDVADPFTRRGTTSQVDNAAIKILSVVGGDNSASLGICVVINEESGTILPPGSAIADNGWTEYIKYQSTEYFRPSILLLTKVLPDGEAGDHPTITYGTARLMKIGLMLKIKNR